MTLVRQIDIDNRSDIRSDSNFNYDKIIDYMLSKINWERKTKEYRNEFNSLYYFLYGDNINYRRSKNFPLLEKYFTQYALDGYNLKYKYVQIRKKSVMIGFIRNLNEKYGVSLSIRYNKKTNTTSFELNDIDKKYCRFMFKAVFDGDTYKEYISNEYSNGK